MAMTYGAGMLTTALFVAWMRTPVPSPPVPVTVMVPKPGGVTIIRFKGGATGVRDTTARAYERPRTFSQSFATPQPAPHLEPLPPGEECGASTDHSLRFPCG